MNSFSKLEIAIPVEIYVRLRVLLNRANCVDFVQTSLFSSWKKRLFCCEGESLNFKGIEDNDNPDVGGLFGHKYRHQFRPNIPVPSKLDVHARNIAVARRKFKRQWNNYEAATRLDSESPKYRTSVSLACIGDEAFDILIGFPLRKKEIKMTLRL